MVRLQEMYFLAVVAVFPPPPAALLQSEFCVCLFSTRFCVFYIFTGSLCPVSISFRFPLLFPVAALWFCPHFFPLVLQAAERAKGAGWVAVVQYVPSSFWVHPASPIQSVSLSALTPNTTHCQRVPVGSWSWQRGCAALPHGQLLTSVQAVPKLSLPRAK